MKTGYLTGFKYCALEHSSQEAAGELGSLPASSANGRRQGKTDTQETGHRDQAIPGEKREGRVRIFEFFPDFKSHVAKAGLKLAM